MTRQYQLETGAERPSPVQTKKLAIEERRRLAMIDALQRNREQTEAVVKDLKNAAILLEQSIESELQDSPTRDPDDVAFPMTARALMTRRDNLRSTIAALCSELTRHSRLEWASA